MHLRRALQALGEIHPNDPWPKPTTSAPPVCRAFSNEFLQYAKTHTKPGTYRFYEGGLGRLLTFAAIADAPLNTITGDLAARYARHRQEVAGNSVVTVNGDLRTLRRVLHLAVEWGRMDHASAVHELPQPKGRTRVLSFKEEAQYLAEASDNLQEATILAVDTTGMRPNSELFLLPWADVDLTARLPNLLTVLFTLRQGKTESAQRSGAALTSHVHMRFSSGARRILRRCGTNPSLCFRALAMRDTSFRYSIRMSALLGMPSYSRSSSIAGVTRLGRGQHSLAWTAIALRALWATVRPRSLPSTTFT